MIPRAILFVCLGNICRSPVAQGTFQSLLIKHQGDQIAKKWLIDSAGTSDYHKNESPDPRSQESTAYHGIDISNQRSRQIELKDFEKFDFIFVMDSSNYKNVIKLTDNSLYQKKVHFFLDSTFPNENRQVPDPYFGGKEGFENVFQMLNKASEDWIERWKQEERV